jgi:hypothetical protein
MITETKRAQVEAADALGRGMYDMLNLTDTLITETVVANQIFLWGCMKISKNRNPTREEWEAELKIAKDETIVHFDL